MSNKTPSKKLNKKQALELAAKIEGFVRELEKAGVRISGWDDEAAYFNHDKFAVRVKRDWPSDTHTVETELNR